MMDKNVMDQVARVLVIVGGLNWGLVGLLQLNVVNSVFRTIPIVEQIVYVLVGLSAVYMVYAMTQKQ